MMSDWMWFGSLAFPPLFRTAFFGMILWLVLRYIYRRFSIDRWFWHTGLVELSFLIISCAITSRILSI